jgi:hypothetical protein
MLEAKRERGGREKSSRQEAIIRMFPRFPQTAGSIGQVLDAVRG